MLIKCTYNFKYLINYIMLKLTKIEKQHSNSFYIFDMFLY